MIQYQTGASRKRHLDKTTTEFEVFWSPSSYSILDFKFSKPSSLTGSFPSSAPAHTHTNTQNRINRAHCETP
jgi:hypothetical protein